MRRTCRLFASIVMPLGCAFLPGLRRHRLLSTTTATTTATTTTTLTAAVSS